MDFSGRCAQSAVAFLFLLPLLLAFSNCDNSEAPGGNDQIPENPTAVVLFADISGFTDISNRLASEDVLQILNRFFSAVDVAVNDNNGEILKFIGDGVLAIFQTPDDLTAQEEAAGAAMQALETAKATLATQEETPKIEFRASLHLGDLFFGNVGISFNRITT